MAEAVVRRSLAEAWLSYAVAVMPEHASDTQRTETRRAFYAGAQAFFGLQNEGYDTGDTEPTDADLAYIQSLHDELQQFCRDTAEGRA